MHVTEGIQCKGERSLENIEWLIKYEREGTRLDFKREQYQREKNKDLIKDIMSMANTPIDSKKYIVVGVKDKPDGQKELYPIPRESFIDQATYEQVIRENIEPSIEFSYFPVEVNGNLLGVFEIGPCNNPPYMMKKDFQGLKKGDCYIRKGSQQDRLTRRDLDELLTFRSNQYFNGKILIGFDKSFNQRLVVEGKRDVRFPSDIVKEKIEAELESRERGERRQAQIKSLAFRLSDLAMRNAYEPIPYERRSTEELEKELESISKIYEKEDLYYLGEEISHKLNLVLRNDGNQYLEEVSIQLEIPNVEEIMVMDCVHKKPRYGLDALQTVGYNAVASSKYYPKVEEEGDYIIVKAKIGDLPHQQNHGVFGESLRVCFGDDSFGKTYKWHYTLYAKNLPNPINGEFTIDVV